MQKARRHTELNSALRPLVSVWFQGLFHSLIQGSFHLSLAVLVHYRSLRSILPWQMVLPDSHRVSRAPCYSGYHYHYYYHPYRAITVYGQAFQLVPVLQIVNIVVLQPHTVRKPYGLGLIRVRSPLLTESLLFSFPPVT